MTTPARILPVSIDRDGKPTAQAKLTAKPMKLPGEVRIPQKKVLPVIVIPGIMGSNLCASQKAAKWGNSSSKQSDIGWRPPNGKWNGYCESSKWKELGPADRQRILHGPSLQVDDSGDMDVSWFRGHSFTEADVRRRGWGQVHWDSYGTLLCQLQQHLNEMVVTGPDGKAKPTPKWVPILNWDTKRWDRTQNISLLTRDELIEAAEYHYPLYAYGYNWLLSNEVSANGLTLLIKEILDEWKNRRKVCHKVLLVTHSMGGLVARACAKRIPDQIAGVIHGVMPALGAPVCYRRLAVGTEDQFPADVGFLKGFTAKRFAEIAGKTSAETTPVLSVAPGPLELLPNHLYPRPWLFIRAKWQSDPTRELLSLPTGNPYELYRDMKSWYRMIDPTLANPAGIHDGGVIAEITKAVKQAERFHMKLLDSYYHPMTYAFYGNDPNELSFASCEWISTSVPPGFSTNEVAKGKPEFSEANVAGTRSVWLDAKSLAVFIPTLHDSRGDGTVPSQSGDGPQGKIIQLFSSSGYSHQECYNNLSMLALTKHLIVKIVVQQK